MKKKFKLFLLLAFVVFLANSYKNGAEILDSFTGENTITSAAELIATIAPKPTRVPESTTVPKEDAELPVGYEFYSELDSLGRCGYTLALVGPETMPTEERGAIGHIKPSGWHTVKYPGIISDNYLYNRCHLIAFCLTGENDNEKNLVTGTRQMNLAMLPYETEVADYVDKTGNHVWYKVTPVFAGNNLVCDGVQIEAHSIEDSKINIDVFIGNVQDGIIIDYATGKSKAE